MRTGKTISNAKRESFKKTLAFAQIQEWCKIHQLSRQKQDSLLTKIINNTTWEFLEPHDHLASLFIFSCVPEKRGFWFEIHQATINNAVIAHNLKQKDRSK